MLKNILSICLIIASFSLFAQTDDKWDVSNPPGDWSFEDLQFTTDEGTWMNLDVSPDGQTIVFDMVGDIYTMPITGGKAKVIRKGHAFEIQPRFSPDGQKISFTSDAGGGDNIWVMNTDGSDAHTVTDEKFRLLNNAVWMPNNEYIVARKHYSSGRSLGAGEMWMYHISGGSGVQISKRKNDQQDVNEPCISADGQTLYYSEDMYSGGYFQYNKDPNKQIYVINQYDFETGKTKRLTGGPGGAARPQISPDGSKMAYVKRVRAKTVLYIHEIESGMEYPIYDALNKDQQEAWAIFGVYPNFDWTPDNKNLIFWSGGKINKINVSSLEHSIIPFEVDVDLQVAKALEFENPVAPKSFTSKVIKDAVTSPDGKHLVFNAVGYLWQKKLPNGQPKRLTKGTDFESEPKFSPDGQSIIFITWNDLSLSKVCSIPANGGDIKTINQTKGIFRTPAYSPDGKTIVFRKERGNRDQGYSYTKQPGIYTMNADGSNEKFVTESGEFPMFNLKGDRLFLQTGGSYFGNLTKTLKSVNLQGFDERKHVESKYAHRLIPSPDEKWILFNHLHKVYLAAMPPAGKTLTLDNNSTSIPVAPLTRDAGVNLHWSADSKKVNWTLGQEYFSNDINQRFTFLRNAPDSIPPIDSVGIDVNLEIDTDIPSGLIALTNVRIITMDGDKVIENGTIIIQNNKIQSLGKSGDIKVPNKAKVYDLNGKTIMPGIVDVHAHIGAFRSGLSTQQHWPFYANLAFGVTTAHDPSAHTETVFGLSELQKSGKIVGPRLFSTGFILYGADSDIKAVINNLDDARSSIKRTKAFGALSVKSYNQPRRDQRQQVLQAAREESIFVVPEGGSTFYHNMTMILDGHTGVEHNIPVAPVYKDILTLWGASKTGYTPTLIVNYGGLNGEYYWYQKTDVWKNEKLLNFYPRGIIDSRSRHRTMVPDEEYQNGHILVSETCKALTDAGVKVNLGAHGQLQGLGAHWELWSLHQGGMTNMEALRAATLNGAEYIGMSQDIGSLEVGKLADLIILDKNPLDDIQNTNTVLYTMINGRLYDTSTMNEIGNYDKPRASFYWESNNYNSSFEWHEDSKGFMHKTCGCH